MITINRKRTRAVALSNMVLSICGAILGTFVIWAYLVLGDREEVRKYLGSLQIMFAISGTILVLSALDFSLSFVLLRALSENSFTRVKVWFLFQSVILATVTLVFLVDLTSPKLYRVIPLLCFIVYKSICLWTVGQLVDEIKQELNRNRLAASIPNHPGNERFINSIDPYYNSLPG